MWSSGASRSRPWDVWVLDSTCKNTNHPRVALEYENYKTNNYFMSGAQTGYWMVRLEPLIVEGAVGGLGFKALVV